MCVVEFCQIIIPPGPPPGTGDKSATQTHGETTEITNWSIPIGFLIHIAMVIIGGLYFDDCPLEKYIPVYLLVAGSNGIITVLIQMVVRSAYSRDQAKLILKSTDPVFNTFGCVVFILGSWLAYKEYEPNYDPQLGDYCDETPYLFAFWIITLTWILFAVVLAVVCIVLTCNAWGLATISSAT